MNLRRLTLIATASLMAGGLAACQQSTEAPVAKTADAAVPGETNVTVNPPDVNITSPEATPTPPSKSESSTVTVTVPDDPAVSGSTAMSTTTTEKK